MAPARRFDHDEAVRRFREDGESAAAIARDLCVTQTAVWRLLDPSRIAAELASAKIRYTAVCEGCGGPCLSIRHAAKRQSSPDGRELCHRCRSDEKIERLRFDRVTNALVSVRCCNIDCANGDRWQDPGNFTRGRQHKAIREGGIHSSCRACQTRARRLYRHAHAEAQRAYDRTYSKRRRVTT